jgi:hypothetical protein
MVWVCIECELFMANMYVLGRLEGKSRSVMVLLPFEVSHCHTSICWIGVCLLDEVVSSFSL